MPTVAIAHSADKHRSLEGVHSLVKSALEHLGGFEAFVKPGQVVFIRPDQSVARLADEGSTTDPLLVAALVRMAKQAGAARVQVGASSSGYLNSLKCMRFTGVAPLSAQEGAELVDLGSDKISNRDVDLPEGRVLHQARLPVPLLEADVIVAVPKAKTDYLDALAGSIELVAGSLNQNWRAAQSAHEDLIERCADIMTVLRPDLWITDAMVCGEGDGPQANLPHWCGCILATADPVAADIAIATILGIDSGKLRLISAAEERGIGYGGSITFLGTPPERVAFQAWPAREDLGHLPVNVIVGKGVTRPGTIGHVKSALDGFVYQGLLQPAFRLGETLTVMLGDAEDPEFERRLQEGPYVVFDDAAQPKYKNDPRAFFVPGHPVLEAAKRELMRILKIRRANL